MKKLFIFLLVGAPGFAMESVVDDRLDAAGVFEKPSVVKPDMTPVPSQGEEMLIIWDLGGIHFDTAEYKWKMKTAWEMGPLSILSHMVFDQKLPSRKLLYEALEKFPLKAEEGFKPTTNKSKEKLPYVQCAYQAGKITSAEVLKMARQTLPALRLTGHFASQTEQDLAQRMIETVFNPANHANFAEVCPAGIEIIQELAAQKTADGKKKYRQVALSNWDRESFALVKARFPEVCALFDDIIISGDIGTIKPNKAAYDIVLKKHGSIAIRLFVDDQIENIDAAKVLGIDSVHFTDYYTLRKEFHRRGLLAQMPDQKIITTPVKVAAIAALIGVVLLWWS